MDYSGFKFNLGGRVNLLYCFFWGIAAVVWIRYGYPLIAKLMAKLKKHILPWMTVVLTVFMAVNMGLSVVYTGTHDNVTTEGWRINASAEDVAYACRYLRCKPEELTEAMICACLASVS